MILQAEIRVKVTPGCQREIFLSLPHVSKVWEKVSSNFPFKCLCLFGLIIMSNTLMLGLGQLPDNYGKVYGVFHEALH